MLSGILNGRASRFSLAKALEKGWQIKMILRTIKSPRPS